MSAPPDAAKRPCPQCGKPAPQTSDNPDRPFCTRRCRELDLAKWFDGDFRIPGAPVDPSVFSGGSDED